MNRRGPIRKWLGLVGVATALALGVSAAHAAGASRLFNPSWAEWLLLDMPVNVPPNEPYPVRLSRTEFSLGMEVESVFEEVKTAGGKSTHEQLSLTPLIGLHRRGSIYHPNLLTFDVSGEAGWSWLDDSVETAHSSASRDENGDLLRYLAQVTLLAGKPYNATFSASQDHTFRNYDSFTTYTVDTERYSGRASWNLQNLTLNADAALRDERSTGINGTTELEETYVNFSGVHTRPRGQSTLTYRYSEFDTAVNFGPTRNSTSQAVSLSDSEVFGRRRHIQTTTGLSYSQYEYSSQSTETVTASENVSVKHHPRLESYLAFNFSHSQMNPVKTDNLQGQAGTRHRLYESLTSTLEVHGNYDDNTGAVSESHNSRYGVGLHEDYTKRLGEWGRLSISGAVVADHEDHESNGGILTILDEAHQLYLPTNPSYRPVYLNQPRVLQSTIQVRGPGGVPTTVNVDYEVISVGDLTEIRLLLGSVVLHDGDPVTVNYQSESLYTASFEALNGSAQVRIDFLKYFGVYGRANWLENNAPDFALTQTLTDLVAGADVHWRIYRLGAEYEDYDSNFSQYTAWRFYQSLAYQTSRSSTLNVDFSQNFYRYRGSGDQDRYQFVTRYSTQLPFSLAWYVEGGYALQTVLGTDQDHGFGRTGLTWVRGKLSARIGYEYNYQATTTGPAHERRDRNFLFAYLKRAF